MKETNRDRRRNSFLFVLDSILFNNAMTFLSVNAVITLFLSDLGAGTGEIVLANALVYIGTFVSQPFFAKKVMNLAYKKKVFKNILLVQRFFFLACVLTIPLFAEAYPRPMTLLFLVSWGIFSLFVGSYAPFYMSLFAKLVPEQHRGRLRGYGGGAANLIALGAAALVGVILREMPYPYNYTLIFAIGVLLLIADGLCFAWMKESAPDEAVKADFNYFQYFKAIPDMFRGFKPFKRTVIAFCFMMTAQASLAYYGLYSVRAFQAGGSDIALFPAITGLANIISSIAFGIMADRLGHRSVLVAASVSGGLAGCLIFAYPSVWTVYAAFALTNFCLNGYNISSGLFIIEQIPRERLPMGISINTMITLIVSSVATVGSGVLADRISFLSVFAIASACGFLGAIVLCRKPKSFERVSAEAGGNP
ncbi:Predicted arabinose efflux permease, MFS family [Paenibacillus sp. UNC496MF]|uniref:MFS transporter n=1 Tax=Paenibacillus sp. UNC496MF TaxID=1502753 RepID=UPI0008EBCC6A|nr:MFS transporter [Paenibacillus sp. UNC496MF]SFI79691.1 Predicted arabinose efflux permease, MFS family [Paenibacillus sp. UNC496MF]